VEVQVGVQVEVLDVWSMMWWKMYHWLMVLGRVQFLLVLVQFLLLFGRLRLPS
jgi:hypothetical protein